MNTNLIRELSSVFKGSMFMQKNTPHMWLKAVTGYCVVNLSNASIVSSSGVDSSELLFISHYLKLIKS
jgi:hypothetical protein